MAKIKKEKPVYDLSIYTKSGKLRKRKQKRKREYFGEETENAIILFNQLEPGKEKDFLFKKSINDNVHKLAEFIINTFKFDYIVDDIEDLKHEMVVFILDRFHLYDKSKGRAYSYFQTIIKRELITRNKNGYKLKQKTALMEDIDEDKNDVLIDKLDTSDSDLIEFLEVYIEFIKKKMDYYFIYEKDQNIVNAILKIMSDREKIKLLNRHSLFFMVKEQTNSKTQEISKVISNLKILYKRCLKNWYMTGELETQESKFANIYIHEEEHEFD